MLAPFLHRLMSRLALSAMLLLVALPSTGRLATGTDDDQQAAWGQICTTTGLKLVQIAASDGAPLDPEPLQPGAPHGSLPGEECAYCPVLSGIALLLPQALVVAHWAEPRTYIHWRFRSPRTFSNPTGLGSRGPPVAL